MDKKENLSYLQVENSSNFRKREGKRIVFQGMSGYQLRIMPLQFRERRTLDLFYSCCQIQKHLQRGRKQNDIRNMIELNCRVIHGKQSWTWLKVFAVCEHEHKSRQTEVPINFLCLYPQMRGHVSAAHPAAASTLPYTNTFPAWLERGEQCQRLDLTQQRHWLGCTCRQQ